MKKAIIYWFSEEEGGRKKPPAGTEYYPTIELEDGSTWSLAIKFDRTNLEKMKRWITVRYAFCLKMPHIIYLRVILNS